MRAHVGWLSFAVSLLAFGATLHPDVPGGDAGELASAACAGGLAHPPGYPLHGLLLRLTSGLNVGEVWARLNGTSALCLAAAAGMLTDVVRRWTSSSLAGLAASVLLITPPLAWQYATGVEVFALHLALLTAFAWSSTTAWHGTDGWRWALVGLTAGLALTHHQTSLLVVVPFLAAQATRWRAHLGWLIGGLAVGAVPLVLLPLFSATDTPFSWGDARSLDGFFTHLLRRDYGTLRLSASDAHGDALGVTAAFLRFELEQGLGLALVGALLSVRFGRISRRFVIAGLASLLLAVVVFGALANLSLAIPLLAEVVKRFFLMPHLLLCAAAGLSVSALLSRARFVPVVAIGVVLSFVVGVLRRPVHVPGLLRDHGRSIVEVPSNAIVLTLGDLNAGLSRAVQACERQRPELPVLDQELLTYEWYVARVARAFPSLSFPGRRWHPREDGAFTLAALLEANRGRPVFFCGGVKTGDVLPGRLVPRGLCERLVQAGEAFDDDAHWSDALRLAPVPPTAIATPGSWEFVAIRDAWNARARVGLFALEVAISKANDATWLERAATVLRQCTTDDPEAEAATWKNLGIAEGRLGRESEMKRALRKYLELAPSGDPELASIRALAQ